VGVLGLGAAAFLAISCSAPGMKMNLRPSHHESAVEVNGLSLKLHSLTPQVVTAQMNQAAATPPDFAALLTDLPSPYRIGPQDILLATVWDHPEITLPMGQYRTDSTSGSVVDEQGYIFFPYVGKLKVSGLTTTEVREHLTASLGDKLRNPQVDVKVIAFRSQKIYVGGEVRNPAVYTITDVPFTLAEAVNRAGGFLPTADDSHILLSRGNRTWVLNFPKLMGSGNHIGQIYLKDGDSLQVPNALEMPVYVMGELVRPGSIPMIHGNLSLARAISEAGGVQVASSDPTSIYVFRASATVSQVDVFHLDGRNPASMVLADKFALQPRDIVFVDAGELVRFSRVMNLVMPTLDVITNAGVNGYEAYYIKKQAH
jgi:polysaccharide export outer membrane protein